MPAHLFLSYSSLDRDAALRLSRALESGPAPRVVWMDRDDLTAGRDWDSQIVEAIRTCDLFLFLMTPDSVEDQSVCKAEWLRALRYKKPVIPLLLDPDAEAPFQLAARHYVDFTGDFDAAVAQLRRHLAWRETPAGVLGDLGDRLADAQRDRRRAADPVRGARIDADIAQLRVEIAAQERLVADPEAATRRTEASITRGIEGERQPRPADAATPPKFINPPPGIAPAYFQNYRHETGRIGAFLTDDLCRVFTVIGRGGVGKTVLVCRLLKALEHGRLPDDGGPLPLDGIVYLSAVGSRRLTFANLYADLAKLLPEAVAGRLDALARDPQAGVEAKMAALLAEFPTGRIILLLDNFEDLLDGETRDIRDADLDAALRALLRLPQHAVKVILTSRVGPRALALVEPQRQARLDLDRGLESPHAENVLRGLDADGRLGLRDAPDERLGEARRLTRGFPRALEALVAILLADRDTTLDEILADTSATLAEHVLTVLIGEAFSRLDPTAQRVMQALALYGRPVPATAVDFLLQPYQPGVSSAPVLSRLVNMQFARLDAGRYYLHPADRSYAFARIPQGEAAAPDGGGPPPFTRPALLRRGAQYYHEAAKPQEQWRSLDDLDAPLAEFDLLEQAGDYAGAAAVLGTLTFPFLHRWGYFRLEAELLERLAGKLDDPALAAKNQGDLGLARRGLGEVEAALRHFERALALDRDLGDRQNVARQLGNIAVCYQDLGQTTRAIAAHEEALAIHLEVGDRLTEGRRYGNLGICHRVLGRTEMALALHERALAILRELGNRPDEARTLHNLATCLGDLGRIDDAVERDEQALALARELGARPIEAAVLAWLAGLLIDAGRLAEAVAVAEQGTAVAGELRTPGIGSLSHTQAALARLYAGDLPAALEDAEAALRHHLPLNNHNVCALLGVIALRQGDAEAARAAFTSAVARAQHLLAQDAHHFAAHDTLALARCGLVLCGDTAALPAAVEAYRAARAITAAPGVVGRVRRLHDALAILDPDGILAPVRAAAAGE